MKRELKRFYGHRWRTKTRPRILARAGGRFDESGRYTGGAHCERCGVSDVAVLSVWQRSEMEIAHLDGHPGDIEVDDDKLACLCHTCHRRHDLPVWAAQFAVWLEQRRIERETAKDAARPILAMLAEAS